MKLELRNLKINNKLSEETTCFSATLVVDGAVAAEVGNRGHGGPNHYYFKDRELEKKVHEWAKTQPVAVPGIEELDQLVDKLMVEAEEKKQLTRWCKTKTVVRLKGARPGEFQTFNRPYTPEMANYVRAKYGDQLDVIMNEQLQA